MSPKPSGSDDADLVDCSVPKRIRSCNASIVYCEICGVNNHHVERSFKKFPFDKERCLQWLRICGSRQLLQLKFSTLRSRCVCSKHFSPSQILPSGVLKSTAVPDIELRTCNLPEQDLVTWMREQTQTNYKEDCYVRKSSAPDLVRGRLLICEICGVDNQLVKRSFKQFPADEKRCLKWLEVCGSHELLQLSPNELRHRTICSNHFSSAQLFPSGKLKRTAVPDTELAPKALTEQDLLSFKLHQDSHKCDDSRNSSASKSESSLDEQQEEQNNAGVQGVFNPGANERCLKWIRVCGCSGLMKLAEVTTQCYCPNHVLTGQVLPPGVFELLKPNIELPLQIQTKHDSSKRTQEQLQTASSGGSCDAQPPSIKKPRVRAMSASLVFCEICGVDNHRAKRSFKAFPFDKQRCLEWLKVCGSRRLLQIPHMKLTRRSICSIHFSPAQMYSSGLLQRYAVPDIGLPNSMLSDEDLASWVC